MKTVECVPNFSEGRNPETIAGIRAAIESAAPVLNVSSDADHHRTVFTFAGAPEAVAEAAVRAVGAAAAAIDLTRHEGVHPRIGAADVVPFVPLAGITLEECARLAVDAGEQIWARFRVPVYLYEAAARKPERRALETFRKAGFTGEPDIGEGRHATAGAVVVGARPLLVAWNIWLDSADVGVAKKIARRIRYSSGGFAGVKALGLPLSSRRLTQVSINSTDFAATPLHKVFQAVETLAREAGVRVIGSELIGLIPEAAVPVGHDLHWLNWSANSILERSILEGRLR